MKKIAIFQENLAVGGIQKSLANLLKNLGNSDLNIDLYLMEKSSFWNIDFPNNVSIRYLKPLPTLYKFLPFFWVKQLFSFDFSHCTDQYDVAIDFNSYQMACALAAVTVPAKKRVMWIHNDVGIKYQEEWRYRVLWNAFKGKFQFFDEFIPCSYALIQPFQKLSHMKDHKFTVIQNCIDVTDIRKKASEIPQNLDLDESCLNFVALGKLCHQKGYDRMLDFFSKAFLQRKDIRLYIIGDGPDREALLQQAMRNGIDQAVIFLGNQANPYCYMNKMDAFISCSRYEGQPLNIMEAKVIGLPLYCTKNLEQYSPGLRGSEDLISDIIKAKKQPKQPDNLVEYNAEILQRFIRLSK